MGGLRKSLVLLLCIIGGLDAVAQLNIDKVKNLFGSPKEPSKVEMDLKFLQSPDLQNRVASSSAEQRVAKYIEQRFTALLFKPYLGKYIHAFNIDKKNNLSADSYVQIFNDYLEIGQEVIVPPFSGTGRFNAQALPSMPEPDNLWFINFSDVGVELNNKFGTGQDKLYLKAQEAIAQGAEAVMFLNDQGPSSDFTNSFTDNKTILKKPVFIVNNAAYQKYIQQGAKGKEWVNVQYDFSKTRRTLEGHNVAGYWMNQVPNTVVIGARYDKLPGKNSNNAGVAALLEVAQRINTDRLKNYNYVLVAFSGTADDRMGAEAIIKRLGLTNNMVSCMINIDDVGALNTNKELYISGIGTSPDWNLVLGSFDKNFNVQKLASGEIGNVNHRSFYNKNIPVINLFTKRKSGQDAINKEGVEAVAISLGDMLAEIDKRPKFTFTKTQELARFKKSDFKVTLGIGIDYAHVGDGVLIDQVAPNSVAQYSNIQIGDVLIKMDVYDIRSVEDYIREMAKYKMGDKLMVKVNRNGVEKQMLISFR